MSGISGVHTGASTEVITNIIMSLSGVHTGASTEVITNIIMSLLGVHTGASTEKVIANIIMSRRSLIQFLEESTSLFSIQRKLTVRKWPMN